MARLRSEVIGALNAIYTSGGTEYHLGLGDMLEEFIEEQEAEQTLFLKTTGANTPLADISWNLHSIKDLGNLDFAWISTPTLPAPGHSKMYIKSDGRVYTLDSAGNEYNAGMEAPSTTTDNAVVRWDGVLGAAVKNSGVLIDNVNNLLWETDGGGNIGDSGDLRPDSLHVKSEVHVGEDELGAELRLGFSDNSGLAVYWDGGNNDGPLCLVSEGTPGTDTNFFKFCQGFAADEDLFQINFKSDVGLYIKPTHASTVDANITLVTKGAGTVGVEFPDVGAGSRFTVRPEEGDSEFTFRGYTTAPSNIFWTFNNLNNDDTYQNGIAVYKTSYDDNVMDWTGLGWINGRKCFMAAGTGDLYIALEDGASNIKLEIGGVEQVSVSASAVTVVDLPLLWTNDNGSDIGSADAGVTMQRPRTIYVGTSVLIGDTTTFTDGMIKQKNAVTGAGIDFVIEGSDAEIGSSAKGGDIILRPGLYDGVTPCEPMWSAYIGASGNALRISKLLGDPAGYNLCRFQLPEDPAYPFVSYIFTTGNNDIIDLGSDYLWMMHTDLVWNDGIGDIGYWNCWRSSGPPLNYTPVVARPNRIFAKTSIHVGTEVGENGRIDLGSYGAQISASSMMLLSAPDAITLQAQSGCINFQQTPQSLPVKLRLTWCTYDMWTIPWMDGGGNWYYKAVLSDGTNLWFAAVAVTASDDPKPYPDGTYLWYEPNSTVVPAADFSVNGTQRIASKSTPVWVQDDNFDGDVPGNRQQVISLFETWAGPRRVCVVTKGPSLPASFYGEFLQIRNDDTVTPPYRLILLDALNTTDEVDVALRINKKDAALFGPDYVWIGDGHDVCWNDGMGDLGYNNSLFYLNPVVARPNRIFAKTSMHVGTNATSAEAGRIYLGCGDNSLGSGILYLGNDDANGYIMGSDGDITIRTTNDTNLYLQTHGGINANGWIMAETYGLNITNPQSATEGVIIELVSMFTGQPTSLLFLGDEGYIGYHPTYGLGVGRPKGIYAVEFVEVGNTTTLSDGSLKQKDVTSGSGPDLTISGSTTTEDGQNGGNIILQPGSGVGAGIRGTIQAQGDFRMGGWNILDLESISGSEFAGELIIKPSGVASSSIQLTSSTNTDNPRKYFITAEPCGTDPHGTPNPATEYYFIDAANSAHCLLEVDHGGSYYMGMQVDGVSSTLYTYQPLTLDAPSVIMWDDNVKDIGSADAGVTMLRPRTVYVGTSIEVGDTTTISNQEVWIGKTVGETGTLKLGPAAWTIEHDQYHMYLTGTVDSACWEFRGAPGYTADNTVYLRSTDGTDRIFEYGWYSGWNTFGMGPSDAAFEIGTYNGGGDLTLVTESNLIFHLKSPGTAILLENNDVVTSKISFPSVGQIDIRDPNTIDPVSLNLTGLSNEYATGSFSDWNAALLQLDAVISGLAGNAIQIILVEDGVAGSETVDVVDNIITVHIGPSGYAGFYGTINIEGGGTGTFENHAVYRGDILNETVVGDGVKNCATLVSESKPGNTYVQPQGGNLILKAGDSIVVSGGAGSTVDQIATAIQNSPAAMALINPTVLWNGGTGTSGGIFALGAATLQLSGVSPILAISAYQIHLEAPARFKNLSQSEIWGTVEATPGTSVYNTSTGKLDLYRQTLATFSLTDPSNPSDVWATAKAMVAGSAGNDITLTITFNGGPNINVSGHDIIADFNWGHDTDTIIAAINSDGAASSLIFLTQVGGNKYPDFSGSPTYTPTSGGTEEWAELPSELPTPAQIGALAVDGSNNMTANLNMDGHSLDKVAGLNFRDAADPAVFFDSAIAYGAGREANFLSLFVADDTPGTAWRTVITDINPSSYDYRGLAEIKVIASSNTYGIATWTFTRAIERMPDASYVIKDVGGDIVYKSIGLETLDCQLTVDAVAPWNNVICQVKGHATESVRWSVSIWLYTR